MGTEAICEVAVDGQAPILAKLHLDSRCLDVVPMAGASSRKVAMPLSELGSISVSNGVLHLLWRDQAWRLHLGPAADRWRQKIADPPSLSRKLGIQPDSVLAWRVRSAELLDFFEQRGRAPGDRASATLWFAEISAQSDLDDVVGWLTSERGLFRPAAQLWVLRRKGKEAPVKESDILRTLAELGMRPSKTAAWSETFTADRFALR
jgi:hypothetical protein